MRVLIPSLRGGSGISTYTVKLAQGLAAAGHEAIVLDEEGGFESPGVTVLPLEPPPSLRYPLEPLGEWARQGTIRRVAREQEVDGIHATRLGLLPLRERRSVVTAWDPIAGPVGRFRAARPRGEDRSAEAVNALVDGVAAFRARAVVAVTPAVRDGYRRFGTCEYVPPFLDDGEIAPARPARGADVVLVAGHLDLARKGLDLAVEAMGLVRERLPEARLVLVGGWVDPSRGRQLPEFCEAVGKMTPAEVTATFAGAGCALIPSLWEEFGYSGLEALAAGTPVATSPLPGYRELSGGGAFAATDRTPAGLAAAIAAALEVEEFEFPAECRASNAIPRILSIYDRVFTA
ncbi:MAG: glycosyltransferase family 4 protein [Solirubrobacterales bacterium]